MYANTNQTQDMSSDAMMEPGAALGMQGQQQQQDKNLYARNVEHVYSKYKLPQSSGMSIGETQLTDEYLSSEPSGHPVNFNIAPHVPAIPPGMHHQIISGEYGMDRGNFVSCIDFANHQMSCPICSKMYRNDHTVYIITIITLIVICIILVKKLLNA